MTVQKTTTREVQTSQEADFPIMLGTAGLALFYAWNFLAFFAPVLSSNQVYPVSAEHLLRLIAFVATTVTLFGIRPFVNEFAALSPRWLMTLVCILGTLPEVLALCNLHWASVPFAFAAAAWAGCGVASACMFLLWGNFSCNLTRKRALVATATSYAAGACWYIVMSYLEPTVGILSTEATLLASVLLCTRDSRLLGQPQTMKIAVSRQHLDLWVKTALRVVFEGCAFGFVLYLVVSSGSGNSAVLVIGAAYILAGMLIAIPVHRGANRLVLWGNVQRVSLPLLVGGLLVIPFANPTVRVIAALVLLFVFACYDMSMWGLLAILGNEHPVQRIYHYSRGRSTIMLGLTLGWGLGCLVNYGPLESSTALLIVSLGLVMGLAVADAITPYGSDRLAVLDIPGTYMQTT